MLSKVLKELEILALGYKLKIHIKIKSFKLLNFVQIKQKYALNSMSFRSAAIWQAAV